MSESGCASRLLLDRFSNSLTGILLPLQMFEVDLPLNRLETIGRVNS